MNYADMTDEELDAAIAAAQSTPPLFRARGGMQALQAERRRRASPPPPSTWSMPDNVNDGLDAAATEVSPDPAVKSRVVPPPKPSPKDAYRQSLDEAGWEEDEADLIMGSEGGMPGAYATPPNPDRERQYAEDWHRREAGHAATEQYWRDVYGHNPQPAMGTTYTRDRGITDFGGGQTAMVDGVEVPVFDLGDGRQRYRLGDVRRAQEAAGEARWLAGHREMVEGDIEKYGHYSLKDDDAKLTPEQVQARQARKVAEKKASDERKKWRDKQIENAANPLTPFEQKEKERRERRADMARLAGGSSGLRGGAGGNMGMFQALAMLSPAERRRNLQYAAPGGDRVAQVDAMGAQNAMRMMNSEALAGMDPLNREVARQREEDRRRAADPEYAGTTDLSSGQPMTAASQAELDRLAGLHDTTWGGFSYQDEMNLAATLQKPPYNMSQPDAEAAANAAAQRQRFWWNQGGPTARQAQAGEAARESGGAAAPDAGVAAPYGY